MGRDCQWVRTCPRLSPDTRPSVRRWISCPPFGRLSTTVATSFVARHTVSPTLHSRSSRTVPSSTSCSRAVACRTDTDPSRTQGFWDVCPHNARRLEWRSAMTLLRTDIERNDRPSEDSRTGDMVRIPGGTFRMGSNDHYPEEAPVHRVTVDGFWIDRTPVTNRQFKAIRQGDRPQDLCRDSARSEGLSRRAAAHALRRLAGVRAAAVDAFDLRDWSQWWTFMKGADWRHPYGPKSNINVLGRSSRRARVLFGCAGLCAMGGQGSADRSRMGIRRARRPRRRRVRLGRRIHARRRAYGQHLAGRISRCRICTRTATSAPRR